MSQTPLLLTTKFHVPPARGQPLPRERLLARLAESLVRPLMLIAAPAGFGKTTLLVDWMAHEDPSYGGRARAFSVRAHGSRTCACGG